MNKILRLLLGAGLLAGAAFAEKIDLGAGRSVLLTVPESWSAGEPEASPPGRPPMGKNLRFVPKSGSNDAVMITLVTVPDDRLADPAALETLVADASEQFVAGSVEGKANLWEFKIGHARGFAVTFTDANLVGQPPVKDDYKTMTACFVYLGDRVLVSATIFSDDPKGPAYGEAVRLLKSLAVSRPSEAI